MSICCSWLDVLFQQKVILVRKKDKPCFDDPCSHVFGLRQEAHLQWTRDRFRVNWKEFVCCQVSAN